MSYINLPSPGDAMKQAVERAQLGEWDGARLWLDIARELRVGSCSPAIRPRPLDRDGSPAGAFERAERVVPAPETPLDRHAMYERVAVPVEPPAYRSADTEVIRYEAGDGGIRCGNCSHAIEWRHGTPDDLAGTTVVATWVHTMTQQSVCPVSAPDQPHTFATPLIDQRG